MQVRVHEPTVFGNNIALFSYIRFDVKGHRKAIGFVHVPQITAYAGVPIGPEGVEQINSPLLLAYSHHPVPNKGEQAFPAGIGLLAREIVCLIYAVNRLIGG